MLFYHPNIQKIPFFVNVYNYQEAIFNSRKTLI